MEEIYKRQEALKINSSQSLCIVGCGGVGYWVAKYAAMSGITTLYLYDDDTFEEHNLNRIDLPIDVIGKNKAQVTKAIINEIRPLATVYSFPFKLNDRNLMKADWLVDCTDRISSQTINQELAKRNGMKYVKVGYDGVHITISNVVAEWGEDVDGYTIIPSWVVPASVVAALAVGKIMKYTYGEVSMNIKDIFIK
jgi:tRNA A37 threonylcarbamoyladenosine dehydratase